MSLAKIIKTIQQHKTFLISTHVNPDADALSSELATALYLKHLKKRVYVINADQVPVRFSFLPSFNLIQNIPQKQTIDYDVAIILDCGDLDRIDRVKALIKKDKGLINIDHHLTNDLFGKTNYVQPQASSTAEVLFDLFKQAKFSLTKEVAVLLYLGIMTDTGSFRYDSTTAYTHEVAAELMKFQFSVSDLYRKLYERVPFDDLKLFTKVINRFEKLYNGRVVYIEMRKKTIDRFSAEFDVRDKIFNFLRTIKGVEVIVILTEQEPNVTRANFRSQGEKVNVADLAYFFKGGGHRKASGCMIPASLSEAKQKLLSQLEKIL